MVTQVDDGAASAAVVTDVDYTSSTSMPSVVAEMLAALRVEPGMSVLEIGTGTGWNAALLAHRLGGANLTSVEIDPDIAGQARTALADAGYGARCTTDPTSPDPTGCGNSGRDSCSTRSAPPTRSGKPPENHRPAPGRSPSPQPANTPSSPVSRAPRRWVWVYGVPGHLAAKCVSRKVLPTRRRPHSTTS